MITEFQVIDTAGNAIADGEIEGGLYRVFSNENPSECEEFENLEAMLAKRGGVGIQPLMFQTPARTRQLSLLGGTPPHERHKTPHQ